MAGETLGEHLRAKGPLNPSAGARLLQEVAWALAYAHGRGVVHRDVKPDNILIEQATGRALVSDFGIAHVADATGTTAAGTVIGTAQYMSPEQASGEPVDARSDLYSLGVVGYYALSGRLPFDAPDVTGLLAMHISRQAPPLADAAPGVPRRLARAIDKCLAKDPAERFPSGEQLAETIALAAERSKEIPAPVRIWLTKGEDQKLGYPVLGFFLIFPMSVVEALLGIHALIPGMLLTVGVPVLLPLGLYSAARWYRLRRLLAAGYGIADIRLALRAEAERRREELAFEMAGGPTWPARLLRKVTFGGLGVAAAAAVVHAVSGVMGLGVSGLATVVFGWSAGVTLVGALLGRVYPGKQLPPLDPAVQRRSWFWARRFGRWFVKLAGIGLRRSGSAPQLTHRPTELAIGLAADVLFESLPKESRRELKDLPAIIRGLEADAQAMRARLEELNAMLGGVGDESPSERSHSLHDPRAGAAVAALAGQREKIRNDLLDARDAVAKRLATAVAALENVRLDLLRLKAGAGTVDQLSADLSAAQQIGIEVDATIAGQRELGMLLDRRPGAAPPTGP